MHATVCTRVPLTLGAVFGLLVGLVSTHEMLLGYRIPSYLGRVLTYSFSSCCTTLRVLLCCMYSVVCTLLLSLTSLATGDATPHYMGYSTA